MDTCKVDMCFDDGAASKKLQIDNFLDICSDRLVKGSNQKFGEINSDENLKFQLGHKFVVMYWF